jgi:MFS family permease
MHDPHTTAPSDPARAPGDGGGGPPFAPADDSGGPPFAPADDSGGPPSWRELVFGRYAVASAILCLGVGTHAVNWFLVATAVPTAVLEIGGAAHVSWATAVYLVFGIVGAALAGDLKTRFGGRAVMVASAAALILATSIAAQAPDYPIFLVGRSAQGLVEGVILALCFILIADVFPARAQPQVFSFLAAVWAVATLAGPALAGVLIEFASWRVALWATVVPAAALLVLAVRALPGRIGSAAGPWRPPLIRLALLWLGAMAICTAGAVEAAGLATLLGVASIVLFVAGLKLDAASVRKLFPARLLHLGAAAPVGLWVIGLMMFAETAIPVFAAFIVQVGFGTGALIAGQVASIPALAWSAAAFAVARLTGRASNICVLGGPMLLIAGLGLTGVGVAAMQLAPFIVGLAAAGAGFGVSHGFLSQRIMAAAEPGETAVTSGAIPTLEGIGSAFGAAAAGLAAAAAGFDGTAASVPTLALVFVAGAAVSVLTLALSVRFVRLAPPPVA